jgi:hypothetical protein
VIETLERLVAEHGGKPPAETGKQAGMKREKTDITQLSNSKKMPKKPSIEGNILHGTASAPPRGQEGGGREGQAAGAAQEAVPPADRRRETGLTDDRTCHRGSSARYSRTGVRTNPLRSNGS